MSNIPISHSGTFSFHDSCFSRNNARSASSVGITPVQNTLHILPVARNLDGPSVEKNQYKRFRVNGIDPRQRSDSRNTNVDFLLLRKINRNTTLRVQRRLLPSASRLRRSLPVSTASENRSNRATIFCKGNFIARAVHGCDPYRLPIVSGSDSCPFLPDSECYCIHASVSTSFPLCCLLVSFNCRWKVHRKPPLYVSMYAVF